ncbi:MAG: DUF2442 domain-containing protein [Nitrospirae bacterium]|nr:DUF2442 domain-containing protein [Nitrospirota bacterium]
MYMPVKRVNPLNDYKLQLTFGDNEERVFDMAPYLSVGKFAELRDISVFNSVTVKFDTIEWANHLDMDPEFLYEKSVGIEQVKV